MRRRWRGVGCRCRAPRKRVCRLEAEEERRQAQVRVVVCLRACGWGVVSYVRCPGLAASCAAAFCCSLVLPSANTGMSFWDCACASVQNRMNSLDLSLISRREGFEGRGHVTAQLLRACESFLRFWQGRDPTALPSGRRVAPIALTAHGLAPLCRRRSCVALPAFSR